MSITDLKTELLNKPSGVNDERILQGVADMLGVQGSPGKVAEPAIALSNGSYNKSSSSINEPDDAAMRATVLAELQQPGHELFIMKIYYDLLRQKRMTAEEASGVVYKLSNAERDSIRKGQEEIARGNYFTQEEVDAEFDEWVEKEDKKWAGK